MNGNDSSNTLELEKTELEICFIPIICSAPLIYAHSHGFFKNKGLSVNLRPAPGWSGIKELMVHGLVDAVHMLSPMPLACNLGIDGKKADIKLLTIQNVNGQALTLAKKHLGIKDVRDMKGFTFGVPYLFSMHYYLLCYFLAKNGVNPLKDVTIKEVSPPRMPYYLEKGWVDGIFAPEPFNQVPVCRDIGFIYILSKDIWPGHPCCSFATSQDFIDRYPNTYQAMLRSVLEAELELHKADVEERKAIAREISGPQHLNQENPVPVEQALSGDFPDGKGEDHSIPDRIDFIPYTYPEYGNWMLSQMQRWAQLPGKIDYREIVDSVFQDGIWELAEALGFDREGKSSLKGIHLFADNNSFSDIHNQPFCAFQAQRRPLNDYDLTKPARERLSNIIRQIAEVAGGKFESEIEITGDDEIGILEQLLNEMILNLKFSIQALDEHSEKLEIRINERSEELEKEITWRKRADEELQKSDEWFRFIVETTSDWVYEIDKNGIITYASRKIKDQLGYETAELIGKTPFDLMPPDEKKRVSKIFQSIMDNREPFTGLENKSQHKNGQLLIIETSGVPIFDTTGNFLGYRGTAKDITERKRSEEEHIRLSAALEQAHDLIKILGPDGTIQYINPATEKVMGYKREEIIGQNPFNIKYKEDADGLYNELRETISQGKMWSGRQTNKKNDGTTIELETIISPIRDKSGNIINYLSISRDVTNEVNMEEQLRQSQKMEAIGTLAGGIAHEFNNILGAVFGYTELSLADTAEGTRAHRNMKEILKAGHRAKDLVDQILKFSRQEKNVLLPLKLTPVVKEAVKFLRASLPATVEVHQNIQPENDKVLSDVTQIHQIVLNLGTNAAYAMREKGGVLEVRMDNVNIESGDMDNYPDLSPGTYLRLTVGDTGHGMDRAVLERIFNPFFTTKQPGEGTGMGLSVIHGIIKSYGGTITVDSELEKGTAFQVLLPCTGSEEAKASDEPTTLPTGSETIMLVDDEEALVGVGQQVLERMGYKVDARTSPVEALKAFQAQPEKYDLVITDKTMPNMTGQQFARELTGIRADIPVILCTGYSEKVEEEEARAAGIKECLKKPLMRQDLARTIRKVLDNRQGECIYG